jgi:hypothetical protein
MRHPDTKPPRRPCGKSLAQKRKIISPSDAYGTIIGLFALLLALRLLIAAAAAMPRIANVGDQLPISRALPGLRAGIVLPAREMPTAYAYPGAACRLDIAMMSQPGGILTVMAVRPDGMVLSWAGGATAAHDGCRAPSGEVLVSENDYAALLTSRAAKH